MQTAIELEPHCPSCRSGEIRRDSRDAGRCHGCGAALAWDGDAHQWFRIASGPNRVRLPRAAGRADARFPHTSPAGA